VRKSANRSQGGGKIRQPVGEDSQKTNQKVKNGRGEEGKEKKSSVVWIEGGSNLLTGSYCRKGGKLVKNRPGHWGGVEERGQDEDGVKISRHKGIPENLGNGGGKSEGKRRGIKIMSSRMETVRRNKNEREEREKIRGRGSVLTIGAK